MGFLKFKKDMDDAFLRNLDLGEVYDGEIHEYRTLKLRDYALLYAIFLFFVVAVVWSGIATVDELTRGMGKVIPSRETQLIQNLEGGIVSAIYVAESDKVGQGQVVMRMSNVKADSEFQANLQKVLSLQAAIARLKAEAEGADEITFPPELVSSSPELVALETSNFLANNKSRGNQTRILEEQQAQRKQEVLEVEEKLNGLRKVVALTREEYKMMAPMAARETISKVEFMQIKGRLATQEADLKNAEAALTRAKAALREADEKLAGQGNYFAAEAQQELSAKTTELKALKEVLASYEDRAVRTEIKAPVDGIVKDIKVTTIGGVVQPGQVIMEIVPLDEDSLVIETSVSPSQIAFLHPGQKAVLKFTAYDYTIYGTVDAVVSEISADSIQQENGESFYRVRLKSEKTAIDYKGKKLPLIPGMVVTADILTGKKTIMAYFLSPFKRTVGNALHEK